jgi:beta-glucosidase
VNFDRVPLKAGETKTVSFELLHEDRALRYWDESKYEFVMEPGPLDIMIGASSADIRLKGQIHLTA